MHYLCSGKCKKVFEMLYQSFSNEKDLFNFYEDGLALMQSAVSRTSEESMILLDYELYKGFSDVIYDVLKARQLKTPVLLIGEPGRNERERVNRWISINELKYDVQNFHLLVPLLKKISSAVENLKIPSESHSAVPAAAAVPAVSSATAIPLKTVQRNFMAAFRKNASIPPSIYNLLDFLYKNRNRDVSIDEIADHMKIHGSTEKERKNTAYAYISRLRKAIASPDGCQVDVMRIRTGYYRLFFM